MELVDHIKQYFVLLIKFINTHTELRGPGKKVPLLSPLIRVFGAAEYASILDVPVEDIVYPPDRFTSFGSNFPAAKAAYIAEPPVWIFWEKSLMRRKVWWVCWVLSMDALAGGAVSMGWVEWVPCGSCQI